MISKKQNKSKMRTIRSGKLTPLLDRPEAIAKPFFKVQCDQKLYFLGYDASGNKRYRLE